MRKSYRRFPSPQVLHRDISTPLGRPSPIPANSDPGPRVLAHDETILTLCVTDVQNNVSISIELASIYSESRIVVVADPRRLYENCDFDRRVLLGAGFIIFGLNILHPL